MESSKSTAKRILILIMVIVMLFSLIISFVHLKSQSKIIGGNSELLRAMTYDQFEEGEEDIDGTENVKFSAFFLRDINGDGYADKLKGTCRKIAESQDTLYMEINVLTEGVLKDAVIQIDSKNFYLETSLPKDNELKASYISSNTTNIQFEDLSNGTQKLLSGEVKSGDYSYTSTNKDAIGNNINNYSRDDNRIILTGTYVAADLSETQITKIIPLTIDWYGTALTDIKNTRQNRYDIENRIDTVNETFRANFTIQTEEEKNQLNISKYNVEGTIPKLNDYDPISVTRTNEGGTFTYDVTTRQFTITKEAEVGTNGTISSSISRYQTDSIEVLYPLEAYESLGTEYISINVPIYVYYEGFNNPNNEFINPYKSNIATANIVANYMPQRTSNPSIDITVGRYIMRPNFHYIVSKAKPIRLFDGVSSEENDDNYVVSWALDTGTNGSSTGLVIKETPDNTTQKVDTFIKNDTTEDSMEDITANVGIYFSNADELLGSDGEIKVYDEDTGILVHTFTSADWSKYNSNRPYLYSFPIRHVKIVTSDTLASAVFYIYNVKEIDDDKIIETYTRTEFDNLIYIKSNVAAYMGNTYVGADSHQASYEAPYSVINISTDVDVLSTQVTQVGMNIYLETEVNSVYNQIGWVNGVNLIKIPSEILDLKINTVTVNNPSVLVTSYEIVEISNNRFIKVNTSNIDPLSYRITINVDMTPDPRNSSSMGELTLYAKNDYCNNYYYSGADSYDIDADGNTTELVNMTSKSVSIVAPNSLLTNQTASEFDSNSTVVISPEIANLKPIYDDTVIDKQTVKIGIQIKNNYSNTISEAVILGKIPFEGNTYVISGGSLESEFSTTMTSAGIIVPSTLQNSVMVYYSTKVAPNKNLNDTSNGWVTAQNVSDWSTIKTWMIDFGNTVISQGAEYIFYYTVEVPNGIALNNVAYSHHGIYFCLDTIEGKYRTQTEPNKIGIKIADKYNVVLTKYQKNKTRLIQGATYRVSMLDNSGNIEDSQTAITNASGTLEMANLYAERIYEIKEVQTPTNYDLNSDILKIIGHVDMSTGNLSVEKLQGTTRDTIQVTHNVGEDFKVRANVEDEAKVTLNVTKYQQGTSIAISNVRYKITGSGLPNNGKNLRTNNNGQISLSGLKVGGEYTIEEIKADGYYLADPIVFEVINNQGTYSLSINEGTVKTSNVTVQNDIPIVNLEVEDEKIPLYSINVSKIEKGTGVDGISAVPVSGAKFKLYKNNKEIEKYTTDANGNFTINDLYQYVEGKDFDATYVLKETYAPEGYAKVADITFKGQVVDGDLTFVSEQTDYYTANGTTINLTIEDSPSFKLIKKDGETNALLPNVKFAIYNVENGEEPARNSKGELIGTKETINGTEYYTVTTNSNGEITADLPEGLYKAVEIEADDKYDISDNTEYFGIGASSEGKYDYYPETVYSVGGSSSDYLTSTSLYNDGSYVVGGYFNSPEIQIGEYTLTKNDEADGMVIKYDSDGVVEWAKKIGGNKGDYIESVYACEDGGCIVGGVFNSDTVQIGTHTLTRAGTSYNDGMIIKFDSSGEVEWANSFGGSSSETVNSVCETTDGKYVAVGYYSTDQLTVGGYTFRKNQNAPDVILLKYNNQGNLEWADSYTGVLNNNGDEATSVDALPGGGFLVGGIFRSKQLGIQNYTLTNNLPSNSGSGYGDGFIVKYTSSNEIDWVKSFGGTRNDNKVIMCSTRDGGGLVAFHSDYSSEPVEVEQYSFPNGDGIIKYDSEGEIEYVKAINIELNSICETSDEGFLIGGRFYGSANIDGENYEGSGYDDGVFLKYNNNGEKEWIKRIGGSEYESIYSIAEINSNKFMVVGTFGSNPMKIRKTCG